jgi:hypothetical protein
MKIFVSYRRDDGAAEAGRIADRLRLHYGQESVFLDVDSIGAGRDFLGTIQSNLAASDVLLAVIGNHWLDLACPGSSRRRIDDPEDYVRLELSLALQRRVAIFPLLINDANMPLPGELPTELRALAYRQAIRITFTSFDHDVAHLLAELQRFHSGAPPEPRENRAGAFLGFRQPNVSQIAAGAHITQSVTLNPPLELSTFATLRCPNTKTGGEPDWTEPRYNELRSLVDALTASYPDPTQIAGLVQSIMRECPGAKDWFDELSRQLTPDAVTALARAIERATRFQGES